MRTWDVLALVASLALAVYAILGASRRWNGPEVQTPVFASQMLTKPFVLDGHSYNVYLDRVGHWVGLVDHETGEFSVFSLRELVDMAKKRGLNAEEKKP